MGKNRFKMGIVVTGLIAASLIAGGAGTASAGDDQGGGGKGIDDVACVILADGHNTTKKQAFEEKNVDEVFRLADEMRAIGENNLCSFYDIDKYVIGVKTDGDVTPPEDVSRIQGSGMGFDLSDEVCAILGAILDHLVSLANHFQGQGRFGEAAQVLQAAQAVQDIAQGQCLFSY